MDYLVQFFELLPILRGIVSSLGTFTESSNLGISIILVGVIFANLALQLLPAWPAELRARIYGATSVIVGAAVAIAYFGFQSADWQMLILKTACGLMLLSVIGLLVCFSVHDRYVFRCDHEQTLFVRGGLLTPDAAEEIRGGGSFPPIPDGQALNPPPKPQSDIDYFCNHAGRIAANVWTVDALCRARSYIILAYVLVAGCFAAGLALGAIAATLPAYSVRDTQEKREVWISPEVLFDTNKSTLRPGSDVYLQMAARQIAERKPLRISVEGHADWRGDEAYNSDLSKRRAETVKAWLESLLGSLGMADVGITSIGFGEHQPKGGSSNDPAALQMDRRVEIVLHYR